MTIAIATAPVATSASRETSERRSSRPNSRGSIPCSAIERPSLVQPVIAVVAAAKRMSAPDSPTTTRRMSTIVAGRCPSNAVTMPTIGACIQSSARSVEPSSAGNADSATIAISTVMITTSPIDENSDRGSTRPGSRVSSARLATVSSPV